MTPRLSSTPIRSAPTEYLKITPSGVTYPTDTIPTLLASLYTLEPAGIRYGLVGRLTNRQTPATFTFTVLSRGADAPVEFYLGSDAELTTLADRLRTIYPRSFEIERVERDLVKQLLEPVEYTREEFQKRLNNGSLYDEPPAASASDATNSSEHTEEETESERDSPESPTVSDGGTMTMPDAAFNQASTSERDLHVDYTGGTCELAPPIALPRASAPATALERPTLTTEGTILARPPVLDETVDCHAIAWEASTPKQHADWTTTAITLDEWYTDHEPDEDDTVADAPLSAPIEALVAAKRPVGLRIKFRRFPDWTVEGDQRRLAVKEGNNIGLVGKLFKGFFEEWVGQPPKEVRERSARRRAFESAQGPDEGSDNAERLDRLNESRPSRSFQVNISAIGLISGEQSSELATDQLTSALGRLRSTLDPLGGPFYEFTSNQYGPGRRRHWKTAQALVRQFADPTATFRTGRKTLLRRKRRHPRPDFVVSPAELASLILVPAATQLTDTAARSVQARQEARTPQLGPAPTHMEKLTRGMALGTLANRALTATSESNDPETVHVPPSLLSYHYLRAATSGAGKSVGVQNDGLSLAEDTQGPIIMVDAKGGDMLENFMRAYMHRYGPERLEEDILYFPVPEILPGLTMFDVRDIPPEQRDQAIRERAAYYEEILKLVMGENAYSEAKNAPQFIRALIEALFDKEHGCENGRYRASTEYFAHDQLDHVIDEFERAVSDAPGGSLPQSTKDHVVRALQRRSGYNEKTVRNILTGVTTRTGKVSEDSDIRPLFNNTTKTFDFADLLDTDKMVLFDLGELRSDPSRIMAGVLLTSLYDELRKHKVQLQAKPDDYIINLLIDEASSVTVSDTMSTLLREGREFRISIGLSTQFPEQLRLAGGESVYLNALNNVGTKIIGKVSVDEKLAEALASEDLSPADVKNRFRSMPRGEFFVSMPSSAFGETGPQPFSVSPMPIPAGHPAGDDPLTDQEEARFQDAFERVKTHTRKEYGIVEENFSLLTDAPMPVCEVVDETSTADLDHVITRLVASIQRRQDTREVNDAVPIAAVNEALTNAYEATGCQEDLPNKSELLTIENRSYLLELSQPISDPAAGLPGRDNEHTDDSAIQIRLSEAGRGMVEAADSPPHQTEGGEAHTEALEDLQAALEPDGWTLTIVEQDGDGLPDARAFHPSIDGNVHFEMEFSTAENPRKVLANLQKAQAADATPVFLVKADSEELAYWARRIDNILTSPVKRETTDGKRTYYTTDDPLTFTGVDQVDGAVTAIRPVADEADSRYSVWTRDASGETVEYVLTDAAGNEYLRTTDLDAIQLDDFAGRMWKDETDGAIIVNTGESTTRYDSRDAFEKQWVTVRQPFIPERDLPNPGYSRENYVIGLMPTDDTDVLDAPAVYDRIDDTAPLESLIDRVRTAEQPATAPPSEETTDEMSSDDRSEAPALSDVAPDFFETCVFTAYDLDDDGTLAATGRFEDGDLLIPHTQLAMAFSNWYEHHYGESVTQMKFSRRVVNHDVLSSCLNLHWEKKEDSDSPLDTTRRALDDMPDDRTRCYLNIGLTEEGIKYMPSYPGK